MKNEPTKKFSEPCVIVPGVAGTTLVDSNTLDFKTVFEFPNLFTPVLDTELELDPQYDSKIDGIVERNHIEHIAYKQPVAKLMEKSDSFFYIFGYDWRQSNLVNGQLLIDFIEKVKVKTGKKSVNVLTHSMGGLVFLGALREGLNIDSLNRVVIAACPFLGSLDAYDVIVRGKQFPILNPIHHDENVSKIGRTFPSAYELCAVFDGAVRFSDGKPWDIKNWQDWQQNLFRDRDKEDKQHDADIVKDRIARLSTVREPLCVYDLSKLPADMRRRMLILGAVGVDTEYEMEVIRDKLPGNFFDFADVKSDDLGDGRVHQKSYGYFKDSIETLAVKLDGRFSHAFFLKKDSVMTLIARFFLGQTDGRHGKPWWYTLAEDVGKVG